MFLQFIMYGSSFFDAVESRFHNFAVNCLCSSKTHVLFMASNAGYSSLSFFGKKLIRLQMSEPEILIASPNVNLLCELVFCRVIFTQSYQMLKLSFCCGKYVAIDAFKYVDVALFSEMFTLYYASYCVRELLVQTGTLL